jgi:hypothetical protein
MFLNFTDQIVSALQHGDVRSEGLVKDGRLTKIYNDLPCFHKYNEFRKWVKDGTLKHPQRRTPKQHQWPCIVGFQVSEQTRDIEGIVNHAVGYCFSTWSNSAYAIESLLVDPDVQYCFRSHHVIKDVKDDEPDFRESCLICANDFDTDLHSP